MEGDGEEVEDLHLHKQRFYKKLLKNGGHVDYHFILGHWYKMKPISRHYH